MGALPLRLERVASVQQEGGRCFSMSEYQAKFRLVKFHDAPTQIMQIGDDEYPKGWSHIGAGCDTTEELKVKYCIPDAPCTLCGQIFHTNYMDEVKEVLLKRNICFTCRFWEEIITRPDQDKCVRVDGRHYIIGEISGDENHFKGHGGRKFEVRFFDGRVVSTNNLWHQGKVPEHFKAKIPDNAIFGTVAFHNIPLAI